MLDGDLAMVKGSSFYGDTGALVGEVENNANPDTGDSDSDSEEEEEEEEEETIITTITNIQSSVDVSTVAYNGSSAICYVGGLVGNLGFTSTTLGVLTNVVVTADVNANDEGENTDDDSCKVGGVAGAISATTSANLYFEGNITAAFSRVGGLVGYVNSTSTLNSSAAIATINAPNSFYVGGLVGGKHESNHTLTNLTQAD